MAVVEFFTIFTRIVGAQRVDLNFLEFVVVKIILVFSGLLSFYVSLNAHSYQGNTGANYSGCGNRPGVVSKLVSDADKMYEKCIVDLYEEYQASRDREARVLSEYSRHLEKEIKKVSLKFNKMIVDCGVESSRKIELVLKCRQLVSERSAIVSHIDALTGWDDKFKDAVKEKVPVNKLPSPACPTSAALQKIKAVSSFNKNFNQTWERCLTLNQ